MRPVSGLIADIKLHHGDAEFIPITRVLARQGAAAAYENSKESLGAVTRPRPINASPTPPYSGVLRPVDQKLILAALTIGAHLSISVATNALSDSGVPPAA